MLQQLNKCQFTLIKEQNNFQRTQIVAVAMPQDQELNQRVQMNQQDANQDLFSTYKMNQNLICQYKPGFRHGYAKKINFAQDQHRLYRILRKDQICSEKKYNRKLLFMTQKEIQEKYQSDYQNQQVPFQEFFKQNLDEYDKKRFKQLQKIEKGQYFWQGRFSTGFNFKKKSANKLVHGVYGHKNRLIFKSFDGRKIQSNKRNEKYLTRNQLNIINQKLNLR